MTPNILSLDKHLLSNYISGHNTKPLAVVICVCGAVKCLSDFGRDSILERMNLHSFILILWYFSAESDDY